MDKVVGTINPKTGEFMDVNGNVLTGAVTIDGVEMNKAVLADAIWQGAQHMVREANTKGMQWERREFLMEQAKTALTYHYIILGFDERKAGEMASEYLVNAING